MCGRISYTLVITHSESSSLKMYSRVVVTEHIENKRKQFIEIPKEEILLHTEVRKTKREIKDNRKMQLG